VNPTVLPFIASKPHSKGQVVANAGAEPGEFFVAQAEPDLCRGLRWVQIDPLDWVYSLARATYDQADAFFLLQHASRSAFTRDQLRQFAINMAIRLAHVHPGDGNQTIISRALLALQAFTAQPLTRATVALQTQGLMPNHPLAQDVQTIVSIHLQRGWYLPRPLLLALENRIEWDNIASELAKIVLARPELLTRGLFSEPVCDALLTHTARSLDQGMALDIDSLLPAGTHYAEVVATVRSRQLDPENSKPRLRLVDEPDTKPVCSVRHDVLRNQPVLFSHGMAAKP